MRLLTILQRICRLFYRKEKDIVDNNVDYATSRERKIKIVQEYYKQREIEAHETYLHAIERNNIYFERFKLSKEWNIVTCNNILESDNLILYLCRNMNHSSCEVHLLKKILPFGKRTLMIMEMAKLFLVHTGKFHHIKIRMLIPHQNGI